MYKKILILFFTFSLLISCIHNQNTSFDKNSNNSSETNSSTDIDNSSHDDSSSSPEKEDIDNNDTPIDNNDSVDSDDKDEGATTESETESTDKPESESEPKDESDDIKTDNDDVDNDTSENSEDDNEFDTKGEPILTFVGNKQFKMKSNCSKWKGTGDYYLEYSSDKINWNRWDGGDIFSAEKSDKEYLYIRGTSINYIGTPFEFSPIDIDYEDEDDEFELESYGDIRNILNYMDVKQCKMDENCFSRLFYECKYLTVAPDLLIKNLTKNCYFEMFAHCKKLRKAPDLPSKKIAFQCYRSMFSNCDSLTMPASLPATEIDEHCYENMYAYCTNLSALPLLPAETLYMDCYNYMFALCKKIYLYEDRNKLVEYLNNNGMTDKIQDIKEYTIGKRIDRKGIPIAKATNNMFAGISKSDMLNNYGSLIKDVEVGGTYWTINPVI